MVRHRKHRHTRKGKIGAALAVFILVSATGVLTLVQVFHRGSTADADASVVTSAALASSTSAVELLAQAASARTIDRGTVGGTLRVRTEVPPDPGTWVAYILSGPGTTYRMAHAAPYEVDVDTRLLPDGPYILNEIVFRSPQAPSVRTSQLRVINTPVPVAMASGRAPARSTAVESPTPATSSASSPASAATPIPLPVTLAAMTSPSNDPTSQVVALTNVERARVGCKPLTVDSRLTAAARAHSVDMSANSYFSHNGEDGRTPFQRMAAAGYQFSVAAENIAAGQRSAAEVMTGWMNSEGHRANILNCSLTQIGVGYATGGVYGTYWTQDFGTP